jgi:Fe-S cluster assembly protein SufB/Fe-S cluster assembly protein SufD
VSQQSTGSFDESLVKSLSESSGDPAWLKEARLRSFKDFASIPLEKNPLYTKYAHVSEFDLSQFCIVPEKSQLDFRSFFKGFLSGKERNMLLQGNDMEVHSELERELLSKGVLLMPLSEALRRREPLLKSLFEARLVKSGEDKYAAFVNAFFNSGTFVYVPKGVVVDGTLRRMLLTDGSRRGVVDLTFVRAEEESKLVFLEELYSKESPIPSLVASTVEIHAERGSNVDFSSIQLLGEEAVHLSNRAVTASDDSRVTVSSLSLGARVSRSRMNFLLNGRGSVAEGFEIFFTDSKQRYDFESNLIHNSPDSTGSMHARGVLKGESESIFKGMIKIVNAAKNSRSYLAHHAMILERTARSNGVPSLEIDNNEVRATHSASVAQIDEEQLFYLMARGLPLDIAKKMVVLGFFEPVLSHVPIVMTRESARFMIEGKWNEEKRRMLDKESLLALEEETTPEVKESEDIFERHYKYR